MTVGAQDKHDDPWVVLAPPDTGKSWKEKNCGEKMATVVTVLVKICLLLGLLYMFICSLDFLSNAFKLLGGKAAGNAIQQNVILSNPIADLMIGVLATVLLQSSSTTTSIVVTMVAAEILTVRPAIFIVMGANIGTSVTNTIVSLGHATERNEFRRAFAGATVHDMFNWLAVICLLPIEWLSGSFGPWKGCGLLCQFTGYIVSGLESQGNASAVEKRDLLKVITKPFTSLIIQLDKDVLTAYSTLPAEELATLNETLIKHTCKVTDPKFPVAFHNTITDECEIRFEEREVKETCTFMFEYISRTWSDVVVGACLLVLALFILCACLVLIVKLLHSLLRGKIAVILKKFVNADFPGKCTKHLTGYLAIFLGAGLTMLVQSSSIFTSAITPLVGVGVLRIERMYPLTLGANIGTTFTAILAALASDADKLSTTLQVALCHLFFNIFGILIWYPIPYMRNVPIAAAKTLGNTTAKYRWFALTYLFLMFFVFPGFIFGLSIADKNGWVLLGVGLPLLIFAIAIFIINKIQKKHPEKLPKKLRNWDFLPKPLHSLEPYDKVFVWLKLKCCCCCAKNDDDAFEIAMDEKPADDHKVNVANDSANNSATNGSLSHTVDMHGPNGETNKAYSTDVTDYAHRL